jgi:hypothetical protein
VPGGSIGVGDGGDLDPAERAYTADPKVEGGEAGLAGGAVEMKGLGDVVLRGGGDGEDAWVG